MKIVSSFSINKDTQSAITQSCQKLIAQLTSAPTAIMVAWSSSYDITIINKNLKDFFPEPIQFFGGTSCLGQMTNQGFHSQSGFGISLLAFCDEGDGSSIGVGSSFISNRARSSAKDAMSKALLHANSTNKIPSFVWICSIPGTEEEQIAGVQDIIGTSTPIFGGSAADNTIEGNWSTISNDHFGNNTFVVAAFFLKSPYGFSFQSGYMPKGMSGIVTEASDRRVHTIDNEPASHVFNRWLNGKYDEVLNGGIILQSSTLNPIGRIVGEASGRKYFQLSHPVKILSDGSIEFFTKMNKGEKLFIMEGAKQSLVFRGGQVVQNAIDSVNIAPADISGAIVVYCAGCMLSVTEKIPNIVNDINAKLKGAPFMGIFSFGEQGCLIGGENRHANLMVSSIVFSK